MEKKVKVSIQHTENSNQITYHFIIYIVFLK